MIRSSTDLLHDRTVLMVDDHRVFADVIASHLVTAGACAPSTSPGSSPRPGRWLPRSDPTC